MRTNQIVFLKLVPCLIILLFFLSGINSKANAFEISLASIDGSRVATGAFDFVLLATNRTSTMEKEMNEAAVDGYRFNGVMGGETSFGGSEVVVIMSKARSTEAEISFSYKLLATSKTSTMQKELQDASDAGFVYLEQTVFSSMFGGDEVVVILEKDPSVAVKKSEYLLLATKKSGTMQKELVEAGNEGFSFVGVTVAETRFGGPEIVCILRRDLALLPK